MGLTVVRADEVKVGDIVWKAQEHRVTRVRVLSVSTAIDTERVGKPGTLVQWHLDNEYPVEVTRPWTLNDSRQDDEPEHVCGPWPYLFGGDCPGCQWREDRA